VAGWLDALHRHKVRLARVRSESIALQFGGAVGTLASLGGDGFAVTEALAVELGLPAPEVPWHTQRDRIVEIATTLGALVGTLGKIARDVSLLMQTEVGEFMEPLGEGRGGSSTMPHKRNPVASAVMLSAATRVPGLVSTMLSAMVQEHERGVGGWHAEWETLTEIVRLTAGCLRCAEEIAEGAIIDAAAMQVDLDLLHGVAMAEAVAFALARRAGKAQSHRIVEEISQRALRDKISMKDAVAGEPAIQEYFTTEEVLQMLEPANYLGIHTTFIQRVLARQAGGTDGTN
jgi:3-carboxy-cis,cis-muconate cycloisomerase